MSIENMRAEFEGYIKDRGHAIDWSSERGVYEDYVVQVAWRCWQVARAELVVELPPSIDAEGLDDLEPADVMHMVNGAIAVFGQRIRAAGVRVK